MSTQNHTTEFADLAAELSRSTVQVRLRGFGGASGVIWRPDGLIITNAHVVRGSHATVELSDGRVFDAAVTAKDPERDLAALQVEAKDLPAATIGDSDTLRVGELVLAIGNPLGLVGALTTGIIHAIGSKDASSSQGWVQADVRLFPGNSGGPLADAGGRVIGINSMIVGGLALAVPTNAVERFLRARSRPYLGVNIQPVLVPLRDKRVFGLLVVEVRQSSPAQQANLLTGDVLIGANGQFFNAPGDLTIALCNANSDMLQLDVMRGGKRIVCSVSGGVLTQANSLA